MKTIKYVPSVCKGDAPKWQGSIELRLPTFDEKFDYIESMELGVNADGDVDSSSMHKVRSIRKLVKMSEKHYISVALKSSDGVEIKSFEDMQYEDDMHTVLAEVSGLMLNGFKVGNV